MATGEIPKEAWANFADFPLAVPPPGVVPNFDHPTWHGHGVVIAACVGIPVMLVMSATRIYSKCYLPRTWVWDDSVFLVSLAAAIVLISQILGVICNGILGYHSWEVKVGSLTKSILLQFLVYLVTAPLLTWFLKLALFSLIFNTFRPLAYVRRLIYVGLILSGAFYIAITTVNGVACGPRGGTDMLSYLAGTASRRCTDPKSIVPLFGVLAGIINFIVDLYLLIIPLLAISKLNLPKNQKAYVFFIFLTGGIGCMMSILGLYCRAQNYKTRGGDKDVTDRFPFYLIVSTAEAVVWVIVPCMAPSAKVLKSISDCTTFYIRSSFISLRTKANRISWKDDGGSKTTRQGIVLRRSFSVEEESFHKDDSIDRMIMQTPSVAVLRETTRNEFS